MVVLSVKIISWFFIQIAFMNGGISFYLFLRNLLPTVYYSACWCQFYLLFDCYYWSLRVKIPLPTTTASYCSNYLVGQSTNHNYLHVNLRLGIDLLFCGCKCLWEKICWRPNNLNKTSSSLFGYSVALIWVGSYSFGRSNRSHRLPRWLLNCSSFETS